MDTKILKQEAEAVRGRIDALSMKDPLIIPIITDMHVRGLDDQCFKTLCDSFSVLKDSIRMDALISLGDNFAMLGREEHITNEHVSELLTGFGEKLSHAADAPAFFINGNHDGIGTDFFSPELWRGAVTGRFDRGLERHDGDSVYYYVDYPEKNLRLVFLSVPYGSDIDTDYPTPRWAFGRRQIDWLDRVALDVPDKTDVIIFSHVPFNYYYASEKDWKIATWDGKRQTESFVSALCGWIDDREGAERVLYDFVLHRGRFIEKKDIALLACIAGHEHYDALFAPGQSIGDLTNRLTCPQVLIGAANSRINPAFRNNARLGVSIDIMVYEDGRLELVRFGDGEDHRIL